MYKKTIAENTPKKEIDTNAYFMCQGIAHFQDQTTIIQLADTS